VLSRVREEHGIALPMALAVMAVLAVVTAALTLNGAVNQRSSLKSADAKAAFALASTAMAYGQGATLAGDVSPPSSSGSASAPGGGTATWTSEQQSDGCNCTWKITAVGTIDGISRTITEIATQPSDKETIIQDVWNYVYADSTSTSCTNLNGNVAVTVPILVRGNLCLGGSQTFSGSQLKVGGYLTVTGSAKIGSSSSKISTLQVAGTCNSVTAGTGVCDGNHSPIYASSVRNSLDVTPAMPCIGQPSSWDAQCTGSNDGTWSTLHTQYNTQAGIAKTGCPAGLFDNDSTLNNSDTSISSVMFGTTDYDCKVGSNEIKWTHSSNSLYVSGTLDFDGSLTLSGTITYSGQATMYFTGGVNTNGSASFCGIANCTSAWNPNTNGIIFIAGCWANSTGSSLTTSGCVNLGGSSNVQFGAYVTTDYATSGSASNMGPVLANTLNLGGTTQTIIPFSVMPPGTPLNYDIYHVPATVKSWSG
jgi:hypothetical protein